MNRLKCIPACFNVPAVKGIGWKSSCNSELMGIKTAATAGDTGRACAGKWSHWGRPKHGLQHRLLWVWVEVNLNSRNFPLKKTTNSPLWSKSPLNMQRSWFQTIKSSVARDQDVLDEMLFVLRQFLPVCHILREVDLLQRKITLVHKKEPQITLYFWICLEFYRPHI